MASPTHRRLRLLTVGDGDLSFSLALLRCYTLEQIDVTISTLAPSLEELIQQYPSALQNVQDIHAIYSAYYCYENNESEESEEDVKKNHPSYRKCPCILYGIDACELHSPSIQQQLSTSTSPNDTKLFDLVLFQYPHVGIDTSLSEEILRQRNISLLHRYLYSASHISNAVHVTLNPNQSRSWLLEQQCYATVSLVVPVQRPVHHCFPPSLREWHVHPPKWIQAKRRREPHRHFLAPYGYRHVRTISVGSHTERVSLSGSCHYVLQVTRTELPSPFRMPVDEVRDVRPQLIRTERGADYEIDGPSHQEGGSENDNKSATVPISCSIDTDDHSGLGHALPIEYTVTGEHVGKRLRYFLQQVVPISYSKRQWERCIKNGAVSINQQVVTDSARILQSPDWIVGTRIPIEKGLEDLERLPKISVLATWTIVEKPQRFWIAWKPVGMRTRGTFHAGTLEQCLSRQLGDCSVRSLTNLDKGCSGLCVLQPIEDPLPVVQQTFTALVYGHCPSEWTSGITIALPVDGVRRWKKPRIVPPSDGEEDERPIDRVSLEQEDNTAVLTLVEQTSTSPYLSTLTLSTRSRRAGLGHAITYYLRRHRNVPVVGDRMAASEYLSLPRPMRNRVKQRWCLGCAGVALVGHEDRYVHQAPLPNQWSARYWQDFCQNSNRNNLE